MDTIKNYLENLFSSLPKTQQVLNAKQQLLENMNDKYDELKAQGKSENEAIGIVISEFGNIDELKAELQIQPDFTADSGYPVLDDEYVSEYLNVSRSCNRLIAFGVALCICSPIGLIIGAGCNLILPGMILLFVFIALAVGIFIYSGTKTEKYEQLTKGNFSLTESSAKLVADYKSANAGKRTSSLIFGVLMCILSPVALISYALSLDCQTETEIVTENEFITLILVGVLLLMVALGVGIIIAFGTSEETSKILLKQNEYAPENKNSSKLIDVIGGIYWPIMVIAYLLWSFLGDSWKISWIIWPVAGILFGIIAVFVNAISKTDDSDRRY